VTEEIEVLFEFDLRQTTTETVFLSVKNRWYTTQLFLPTFQSLFIFIFSVNNFLQGFMLAPSSNFPQKKLKKTTT